MLYKRDGLYPEYLINNHIITTDTLCKWQIHKLIEDMDIGDLRKLFTCQIINPNSAASEEKLRDFWGDEGVNAEIMGLKKDQCFKIKVHINV